MNLDAGSLLRAERQFAPGGRSVPWRELLWLLGIGGFIYGASMGSFGLRATQSFYSGAKVPLLLIVATAICLPNFYVVNTLLGLREDFAAACRGVIAAQATVGVTLASLAPVVLFIHASTDHYRIIVLSNGVLFACATLAGQVTLNKHYRVLVERNSRHNTGRVAWVTLYVFVAIQMAWILRPFIGAPNMPSQFLRDDPWSNAYVRIAEDIWVLFSGSY